MSLPLSQSFPLPYLPTWYTTWITKDLMHIVYQITHNIFPAPISKTISITSGIGSHHPVHSIKPAITIRACWLSNSHARGIKPSDHRQEDRNLKASQLEIHTCRKKMRGQLMFHMEQIRILPSRALSIWLLPGIPQSLEGKNTYQQEGGTVGGSIPVSSPMMIKQTPEHNKFNTNKMKSCPMYELWHSLLLYFVMVFNFNGPIL